MAGRCFDVSKRSVAAGTQRSTGPARALGLSDRGDIAQGLRADLVVINKATRQIEATIAGGRLAYLAGPVVTRFFAQTAQHRLAAE